MKLVGDGFVLLVLGQLVVFLFIFLMVGFIHGTAGLLHKFTKEAPEPVIETPAAADEGAEIAAVAAAVQAFRAS